jgi:hypothetical protein
MVNNTIENLTDRKKRSVKLQKKIQRDYQAALNKGEKVFNAKLKAAKKNNVSIQWVYESLKSKSE